MYLNTTFLFITCVETLEFFPLKAAIYFNKTKKNKTNGPENILSVHNISPENEGVNALLARTMISDKTFGHFTIVRLHNVVRRAKIPYSRRWER